MTMSRAKLSAEEQALLDRQLAGVEPLRKSGILPPPEKTEPVTKARTVTAGPNRIDDHSRFPESALGEPIQWLRPGQQKKQLRTLKSPGFRADKSLDLHGLTEDQARRFLQQFLEVCERDGAETGLIIHGKGLRSENNQPVLKNLCVSVLIQTPTVLGFHSAGRRDGGTGATRVLFRTRH